MLKKPIKYNHLANVKLFFERKVAVSLNQKQFCNVFSHFKHYKANIFNNICMVFIENNEVLLILNDSDFNNKTIFYDLTKIITSIEEFIGGDCIIQGDVSGTLFWL